MDKKIWLGIGILVVVAGGWYFSSGDGLKGSFYEESSGRSARNTETTERRDSSEIANEIAENNAGSVSAAPSTYVGHYYFTNKDTTIGEIYQAIGEKIPVPGSGGGFSAKGIGYLGQKIIYYDKGYLMYPVNIFGSGKVALLEQKIPKNRGIALYNEMSAISISDSPILRPPTAKPSNATTSAPLADNESGWVLMASKEAKLSDFVAPFKDRVISAFALTSKDKFEKVDVSSYVFGKYSLAWIRLGVKGAPLTPNLGKELPPQSIEVDTFAEMEEIDFGTEALPPLNEGAYVLGKWKNGYQWYRGTLGAVNSNGADINYNDGDKEQAVGWDKIADFDSHPESVKIGQAVVIFSDASGAYWSAKVKAINGDQITVTFDDDGKNKTVSMKKDLWVPVK